MFALVLLSVFIDIQVIDLPGIVHWPLVIAICFCNCELMLSAKNLFLIVIKCLPSLFHEQPIL